MSTFNNTGVSFLDVSILAIVAVLCTLYPTVGMIQGNKHRIDMKVAIASAASILLVIATNEPNQNMSRYTLSLLAVMSLAFNSVFMCSQNRAVEIGLYLLRIVRLAMSIKQVPPALTCMAETLLHLFVVWSRHLSKSEKTAVKDFLSAAFGIRSFFFLRRYFQRGASLDDMCGPKMNEKEIDEIFSADEAIVRKRYSAARTLLLICWKDLACFAAIELTTNLVKLLRSMIFVSILAAIEDSKTSSNTWYVVSLVTGWQLLLAVNPIYQYSNALRDNLSDKVNNTFQRLVSQRRLLSKTKDLSEMWRVWSGSRDFVKHIMSLVKIATFSISQLASMWIVTKKIGWRVVIPLIIGLVYSILSQVVNRHIEYLCKKAERERMPSFRNMFSHIHQNFRAIKFYAWEDAFLGAKDYHDLKDYIPPLFWRLANYFLDFVGNTISEISAALTIGSYLKTTQTLRYSELSLIFDSVGSTTTFVQGFAQIRKNTYDLQKSADYLERLFAEEEFSYIERVEDALRKMSVKLKDAVFSWGSEKYSLKPIELQVESGDFVTVVGRIGSGKSSLLSGIIGEMPLFSGHGCISGSVGYVEQKPWIMDSTFRENVLMTSDYDVQWFQKVVDACALTADLEQMPEGDLTIIGSGGINLSGGQKVRLALARAMYRKADVYILDDVLAAVDSQTERHIVERVLLGDGIISKKTRILVTHAMHVVPFSNIVVTMEDGQASWIHQTPAALGKYKVVNSSCSSPAVTSSDESKSKYGTNSYEIRPELDAKQDLWKCLTSLLRLSSYSVVAVVILFRVVNAYALYYVNSLKLDLMSEISVDTLHILRQYLVVNVLVQVGRQQLTKAEEWFRKTMWSKKLQESMRLNILTAILSTPVPTSERMSASSLDTLFGNEREAASNVLPKHLSTTLLSNTLSATSAIMQAAKKSPMLILACLPVVGLKYGLEYIYLKARRECSDIIFKQVLLPRTKIEDYIDSNKTLMRVHGLGKNYLRLLTQAREATAQALKLVYEVAESKILFLTIINELLKVWILTFKIWQHFFTTGTVTPGEIEAEMNVSMDLVDRVTDFVNNLSIPEFYLRGMTNYMVYTETMGRERPRIIEDSRTASNWPEHGTIEFKDYCMRYRPELDTVINQLSFSIRGAEKIGIVGRTGAGKSSLSFALMRLVEADSGQILIDGVDISTIGLHDLRTRISIIPQDPALMTGTIRENLDPLDQYTDEEVWAAIRTAHISDLMEVPTDKYNEVPWDSAEKDDKGPWLEGTGVQKWVEHEGKNFSVGQRQLVCLSRALLWKRQILIMDEATANMDPKTDKIMQSVVREMFKDCTVLTIAHRLDTVMGSDRILVMDGGRAVEFDTPANLLAQGKEDGYFAKLVESMKLNQNI